MASKVYTLLLEINTTSPNANFNNLYLFHNLKRLTVCFADDDLPVDAKRQVIFGAISNMPNLKSLDIEVNCCIDDKPLALQYKESLEQLNCPKLTNLCVDWFIPTQKLNLSNFSNLSKISVCLATESIEPLNSLLQSITCLESLKTLEYTTGDGSCEQEPVSSLDNESIEKLQQLQTLNKLTLDLRGYDYMSFDL